MKKKLDQFEAMLANHTLEVVERGEKLSAYYLRSPEGGRIMSTLIVFTPEGIAIQGDLTPSRHGDVSAMGYGVEWFAGQLSDRYLCEKFLTKTWVRELAVEQLSDPVSLFCLESDDPDIEKLKEVGLEIGDEGTAEALYEALSEINPSYVDDGIPGWDYDPRQACWLVAIQRRFSVLYQKHSKKERHRSALKRRWVAFRPAWCREARGE